MNELRNRPAPWMRSVAVVLAFAAALVLAAAANATNGKVLILDSTVSGGASSPEAVAAVAAGKGVDVVTSAQWSAMTTADFAQYDALVLGDPNCQTGTAAIAAPSANPAVWGPAVNGNVIIIGTDPVLHSPQFSPGTGAQRLITNGVAFAGAEAGTTGLYATTSCYYYNSPPNTPVPMFDNLSTFGTFQLRGQTSFGGGCPANSHIVATHPALTGLTDADLSNWSCSAHESFDQFPPDFAVLAINKDIAQSYTASDGTVGGPYILARGKSLRVISNIQLDPATATNPTGTSHTLTATVKENDTPVAGKTVTFTVIAGPHSGVTGTGVTNASGVATFSYTGTTVGTDLIHATYVDSLGHTQTSNTATKEWTKPETVANCATASPLIGTMLMQPAVDNDVNGLAEAFRATATATGTASLLCIYVDLTNTATALSAGIYADNGMGHPGALLSSGSLATPAVNGTFNTILIPSVPLAAGTKYWIAVLSPYGSSGVFRFRDRCCGAQQSSSPPSENSKVTTLASLPATWATGKIWPHDGPIMGWGGGAPAP